MPPITGRNGTRNLLLGLILIAGCTVRWISTYDESTDKGVTALQPKVDALLQAAGAKPPIKYADAEPQYKSIYSDLDALIFRNEARPKNDLTTTQLKNLRKQLQLFQDQQQRESYVPEMAAIAQSTIDQSFLAILHLELQKKEE